MLWTLSFFFLLEILKMCYNILALMLDPRFKSTCLVCTYVGHENASVLVVAYDEQMLLSLLMEVYKSSMPLIEKFQAFESLDGGCLGDLFHTTIILQFMTFFIRFSNQKIPQMTGIKKNHFVNLDKLIWICQHDCIMGAFSFIAQNFCSVSLAAHVSEVAIHQT